MINHNSEKHIKDLIDLVLNKKISVSFFCDEFERIYNFDLELQNMSGKKQYALEKIFNKVVYFSPFVSDRETIKNYLDEEEIIEEIKKFQHEL